MRILVIILLDILFQLAGHAQSELEFELLNAAAENDTGLVATLLDKGVNVNTATFEGVTPLMYAVQNNNFELVKLLLDHDADINAKPWNGTTALIASVKAQNLEMAEFLIRHGADINGVTRNGISALMYAAAYNYVYITDMLLYYDANESIVDSEGNTALLLAAFYGNIDIVKLLIKNSDNLVQTDFNGNSLLHKAVESSDTNLIQLLIDKGLNIDYLNFDQITPLALAVKLNQAAVVRVLLINNAKVNYPEAKNKKPIQIAEDNNNKEIINILKKNGASVSNWPNYNNWALGLENQIGTTYNIGFVGVLNENKYNTHFIFQFLFWPVKKAVLFQYEKDNFYQYWERRYFICLGLGKDFELYNKNYTTKGIYTNMLASFSFGNYTGAEQNPQLFLKAVPNAGFYIKKHAFEFRIGYQYLDIQTYSLPNHYLQTSLIYHLNYWTQKNYLQYFYE